MQEKWGKLKDIGFPRLLHNIFTARNSASILDMETRNIKKRIFFKIGIPVYAISNVLNEVLGRSLMRQGVISQDIYEESLEIMLKEKKKQGEILILKGYITPHQLNDALNRQIRERLWSVFEWNDGAYHYYTVEKLPKDLFLYPIHPAYAILYAVRSGHYPPDRIKTELDDKGNYVVVFSDKTIYTIDDFQPTPQERRILTLIDGRKNLEEIVTETKLTRPEIYPFIYSLLSTNVILLKPKEKRDYAERPAGPSPEDKELIESLTAKHLQLRSLNHFEILGIGQSADSSLIKKAYFKLAKEYHPDRFHNNIGAVRDIASDIFTTINTAYNTLSDEKNRKSYEDALKSGRKQDISQDAANIMNAELQFQKSKIALAKKDYRNAKKSLEWALKLNPDEGEYKTYMGWTIFNISPKNAEEVKRAKELIQQGIAMNPSQDMAYYFLGVIYRVEDKIEEAEIFFNKAIQKNPNIPGALSELRLIQMRKHREGKGFLKNLFKQ